MGSLWIDNRIHKDDSIGDHNMKIRTKKGSLDSNNSICLVLFPIRLLPKQPILGPFASGLRPQASSYLHASRKKTAVSMQKCEGRGKTLAKRICSNINSTQFSWVKIRFTKIEQRFSNNNSLTMIYSKIYCSKIRDVRRFLTEFIFRQSSPKYQIKWNLILNEQIYFTEKELLLW